MTNCTLCLVQINKYLNATGLNRDDDHGKHYLLNISMLASSLLAVFLTLALTSKHHCAKQLIRATSTTVDTSAGLL